MPDSVPDPREIAKFAALSDDWWNPDGKLATLHAINPTRMDYISKKIPLEGKKVIDIGCGGGILSEALAKAGAHVTGIDPCEPAVKVAKLHRDASDLDIDYQCISADEMARLAPASFDVISCLEMLEHTKDPAGIIAAAARLAKPGALLVFSTLNRSVKSFFSAIVGAEYLLGLLPRNTHDFSLFIRPAELTAWLRQAGLVPQDMTGLTYHPFSRTCTLSQDVSVNYMVCAEKP